ncbi:hypothetical protein [Pseudonocardia sp. GCM10023141]|uniref:hypothetical protein n=1 Tax=Pseudonocardia sp. GCM10023141 TaxID=3252653 RepID=UPI0036212C13
MSLEQKRAWIALVVAIGGYVAYLVVVLGRAGTAPLAAVAYAGPLVWTVGIAVAVSIIGNIAVAIGSRAAGRTDQRDREISRFGGHIGHSFVVLGAVAALLMALVGADHFWIANAVYLAFVLSAVLGSVARLAAYRWGLPAW